jgi:putative hydrolase of the HAD superfamily
MNAPSQEPIRALLFDLDDTLWPITPVIERAETLLFDWLSDQVPLVTERYTIATMRARRIELMAANPRFRVDLWALRHAALHEAFVACGADTTRIEEAMDVFTIARNQVTLFDDVLVCLRRLAERITLGSLTNGGADLRQIGLDHHFAVSLAAHEIGRAKPDPAVFHAACEALALPPSQVAYVGDDLRLDVEGAQKAGLRGIWLNRDGAPKPAEQAHIEPDASIVSLHELELWLHLHSTNH